MNASSASQSHKRKLLGLLVLGPWVVGCSGKADADDLDPQKRFKHIGVVLVVDAVPGAEMEEVVFHDDRGVRIYGKGLVARETREIRAVGSARVPVSVRVEWREGAGWDKVKQVWDEGTIVGDYTVPVAERIPDEVLDSIRKHGGGLRIKFRLKPDGVMFGWDIERSRKRTIYSDMPGGDFLETEY